MILRWLDSVFKAESRLGRFYRTSVKQTFRQDALAAFARITALVCRNSDRFSGGHLASLQREVFGNAIDPDDARRVLSLLEDAKGGDTQACVSPVDTFARLMTVFVDNGRKDNVWRILRHFGYDADLRTSSSYGDAKISLKSDGSEVLEFSDQAWHFLTTAWADCIEVRQCCSERSAARAGPRRIHRDLCAFPPAERQESGHTAAPAAS